MLLLKRIIASILDLLLFVVLSVIIDWLFIRLDVTFSNLAIYYISFVATIIFPILIFGRTIGYKILKIETVESRRFLIIVSHVIKYFLLFSFYSNFFSSIFSFVIGLVNEYSNFNISSWFSIRLAIVLLFLNAACFLLTLGSQNLVDYILAIKYQTRFRTGLKIDKLFVAYFFCALMLLSTVAEYKLATNIDLDTEIRRYQNNLAAGYFPPEIFNNYAQSEGIFSSVEATNRIVTDSDLSSFYFNRFLLQRQVIALIDGSLLNNPGRRKELCVQLINYAKMNEYRLDGYKEIMQTKIILVNIERQTPFTAVQTIYSYYYDHKRPFHGIYGGYNVDSLSAFYANTQESYYNKYFQKLSDVFHLPVDTLKKYQNDDGTFSFPEELIGAAKDLKIVVDYGIKDQFFPVVQFDDVQPVEYLSFFNLGLGTEAVGISALQKGYLDPEMENMFWLKMNYIFSR